MTVGSKKWKLTNEFNSSYCGNYSIISGLLHLVLDCTIGWLETYEKTSETNMTVGKLSFLVYSYSEGDCAELLKQTGELKLSPEIN